MSFGKEVLGFGGFANREGAYSIDDSLCFSPNGHLSRLVSTASNRKTWTWSGWVKRSSLSTSNDQMLFNAYANTGGSDSTYFAIRLARTAFNAQTDSLVINGWNTNWRITDRLLRDVSAWYHIVVAVDTTQSTANDRIKVYINGEQITSFQTTNNPSQNDDLGVNVAQYHMLGAENMSGTDRYYNGYMAEVHFVDGTALTASSFGKTDSETGQWVAKEVVGVTYGTNGFYFKFKDAYPANITATGGTITTDGNFKVHTFTSSGTFTVTDISGGDGAIDYLVIAGGGGGGYSYGGGGGAGGYRTSYNSTSGGGSGPETRVQVEAQAYTITVGAGTSGMSSNVNPTNGNGNASSIAGSGFTTISCVGGGGGGHYSLTNTESWGGDGAAGGSGGGVGTTDDGNDADPGAGTAGQGYAGGPMRNNDTSGGAAGGGGAGGVGSAVTLYNGWQESVGGNGGPGVSSTITGSSVQRAGGGGGGGYYGGGSAGAGGGGAGGRVSPQAAATSGTANTGGGGGATPWTTAQASGGSGVVIIRYKFQ